MFIKILKKKKNLNQNCHALVKISKSYFNLWMSNKGDVHTIESIPPCFLVTRAPIWNKIRRAWKSFVCKIKYKHPSTAKEHWDRSCGGLQIFKVTSMGSPKEKL
jgi:hypothetical protein